MGELFMAPGTQYTAAQVYGMYRRLRLVVIKRKKTESCAPGSASAKRGVTAGPLQAAAIRREVPVSTNEAQLVAEYCQAMGLADSTATKELTDAAVGYLHKVLLLVFQG